MAIIYSYPELLELQGRDLLLISDLSSENKPTMRVELSTISAYISKSIQTGVTSIEAGEGISIDQPTGNVKISAEGGTGDKTFLFQQVVPSSNWTIIHDLDKFPSVSVVDSSNDTVQGLVTYISKSEITINFSASFSGKAYLN